MIEYSNNTRAIIWMQSLANLPSQKIRKILDKVESSYDLLKNYNQYRTLISKELDSITCEKLEYCLDEREIDRYILQLDRNNVELLPYYDERYPSLLTEISDYPIMLYCKGDISLLNTPILAVVGTRAPTRYGREVTENFVDCLSKTSLTIASGLARGIDSIAHRVTLDNNGKTIGVLGCGIDKVYPAENIQLYNRIEEDGLIISEYGIGVPPNSYNFPARNRIISGIAKGVFISEAGLKSGSLITANFAASQHRKIFCPPHALNNKQGAGCNQLLLDSENSLVLSPDDVALALRVQIKAKKIETQIELDYIEQMILNAITDQDTHFDTLLDLTELGVSALNVILSKMEMYGLITKISNNYYSI